ncbi:hypothetical protein HYALB_00008258 [Hymenoscyphus albidus]|uniref:Uncharacterized protein n=1 Tax=Hymenoscyphus albidus TaxID=595503 RepID=A0A9N9PSI1_9HELO|nr:hypothetical protein HYALB_00008258 [Hymenoscyphus albidus]
MYLYIDIAWRYRAGAPESRALEHKIEEDSMVTDTRTEARVCPRPPTIKRAQYNLNGEEKKESKSDARKFSFVPPDRHFRAND